MSKKESNPPPPKGVIRPEPPPAPPKRKCKHIIGVYDDSVDESRTYELVEKGYNDHYADKSDDDFCAFKYCPECGAKIQGRR